MIDHPVYPLDWRDTALPVNLDAGSRAPFRFPCDLVVARED